MNHKILFVDDEPAVLEGYKRVLYKDFHAETAVGGEAAIAAAQHNGPYAVVVSDMRMPGMDGVQVLSRMREISPETVRVILTGYADMQSAIDAVNEGRIFRFLTKPCEARNLKLALNACLMQYQLVTAEKELLENTLMGSIKVLTDVLSLANPAAFGRSKRIAQYVQHMVAELHLQAPWKYEVAAMLSQLGCVALESDLIDAACGGKKLTPEEQARFDAHPDLARELLSNVPRLEGIAWIIGQQRVGATPPASHVPEDTRIGAAILHLAIAFDRLRIQGVSESAAVAELRADKQLDQHIVDTLATLKPLACEPAPRAVHILDLTAGMVLQEEIRTKVGVLLVAKGQEVSYPLLVRLRNYYQRRAIPEKVLVLVPAATA
jgi:response regulator RpfG family c-di-GMP phosphodiesterase